VSVDRAIGDLPQGDVLIEGARITAVGRNLTADNAQVLDARDMIVT
jgi:5-methylthioadenosine/S-adenosylhomocysteine deaminase